MIAYEIFDRRFVSIDDLCSLAQTCKSLKEIASSICERRHKICDLKKAVVKRPVTVLQTFGANLSDLRINFWRYSHPSLIMDAIIQNCTALKALTIELYKVPDNQKSITKMGSFFAKLEKLHMHYVSIEGYDLRRNNDIITAKGTLIDFLSKCRSLIDFKAVGCSYLERIIFDSTFPKLEHLEYQSLGHPMWYNMEQFIQRHRNLKTFLFETGFDDIFETSLNALTVGCEKLEKFHFVLYSWNPQQQFESLIGLSKLQHLKELKIHCLYGENATKLIAVLPNLSKTLENLDLHSFHGNTLTLMPSISKLKNLRILRLSDFVVADELISLNEVGALTKLVELSFEDVNVQNFDVIKIVRSLISLRKLKLIFNGAGFEITENLRRQLVDVVKNREDAKSRSLKIKSVYRIGDEYFRQTVEF